MDKIIENFFNMSVLNQSMKWLMSGLGYTAILTLIAMITSLIVGLFTALARISKRRWLRTLAGVYINIFRGTPLLVQVIILFFAFPYLGIQMDRWTTAILALTLNNGSYVAEFIRGGIQSIDAGQEEAAKSLGMNYVKMMFFVILPQALKQALPALANSFVSLLKRYSAGIRNRRGGASETGALHAVDDGKCNPSYGGRNYLSRSDTSIYLCN